MSRARSIRNTTSDYPRLDVRWLSRQGYLRAGWSGGIRWSRRGEPFANIEMRSDEDLITLHYRTRPMGGEWELKEYEVSIERMPCRFGGQRAWFLCPVERCGRRVAVLYGSSLFACRRCLDLAYPSQQETRHDRALSRAQAIHEKLGGTGIIHEPLSKPKGMHWRTYYRHLKRFHEAESSSIPPWLLRMMSTRLR